MHDSLLRLHLVCSAFGKAGADCETALSSLVTTECEGRTARTEAKPIACVKAEHTRYSLVSQIQSVATGDAQHTYESLKMLMKGRIWARTGFGMKPHIQSGISMAKWPGKHCCDE